MSKQRNNRGIDLTKEIFADHDSHSMNHGSGNNRNSDRGSGR